MFSQAFKRIIRSLKIADFYNCLFLTVDPESGLFIQTKKPRQLITYLWIVFHAIHLLCQAFYTFYIQKSCRRCAKKNCVNVGIVSRLRRHLTQHMLTVLLNADVNAVTDYCLTVWGPSRKCELPQIQSKVNQSLATYCYPKLSKYYTKTC